MWFSGLGELAAMFQGDPETEACRFPRPAMLVLMLFFFWKEGWRRHVVPKRTMIMKLITCAQYTYPHNTHMHTDIYTYTSAVVTQIANLPVFI